MSLFAEIVLGFIALVILGFIARNIPGLIRYIRISNM
jgi:hypothetical protein